MRSGIVIDINKAMPFVKASAAAFGFFFYWYFRGTQAK
jgi:hypothetical protein